jgi:hypothetical protein
MWYICEPEIKDTEPLLNVFLKKTLHAPENAPEVRIIPQALPPSITYDIAKQSFSLYSVKLNMKSPYWFVSFQEERDKKETLLLMYLS